MFSIYSSGLQPGVATQSGGALLLEGSRVDILCTQIYYICSFALFEF